MSIYWGVDSSYYPANKLITVRGRRLTVWEYMCEEAAVLNLPAKHKPGLQHDMKLSLGPTPPDPGLNSPLKLKMPGERQPDFWGRYLGRHQITQEEAQYIFDKSGGKCRILLVYNLTNQTVVGGDYRSGMRAATNAISRAASVGAPNATYIYCDIEGIWKPTAAFLRGWWDTMLQSSYGGRGGIYCKTTEPNLIRAYLTAMREDNPDLVPDPPNLARYIWTTRPQVTGRHKPGDYLSFAPIEPADARGGVRGSTVVHQYALDRCNHMVDFDVASQAGYDGMWANH